MSNPNPPEPQHPGLSPQGYPHQAYGQQGYPQQGHSQPGHPTPGFGAGQQFSGQPQQPLSHAQAQAQARGARAQAKALRPWFKKKRFILPLALIALFTIFGIAGMGEGEPPVAGVPASSTSAPTAPSKKAAKEKPAARSDNAKIGDAVKAGDWKFEVTKFKCGIKSVGNQYLKKKPQGQFCFLSLSATNNGDAEGTLNGDSQKLLDADGKEFSSDSEASIYLDSDSMLFLEGVNPGNTAKGVVVFDIPKNAKPTQVSLAGGLFGGDSVVVDLK